MKPFKLYQSVLKHIYHWLIIKHELIKCSTGRKWKHLMPESNMEVKMSNMCSEFTCGILHVTFLPHIWFLLIYTGVLLTVETEPSQLQMWFCSTGRANKIKTTSFNISLTPIWWSIKYRLDIKLKSRLDIGDSGPDLRGEQSGTS